MIVKLFTMWDASVHYCDGWFIYTDGRGRASVISGQRARDLEKGFNLYQASQDIDRGGCPPERAYERRGIKICKDDRGDEYPELVSYSADYAVKKEPPVEMKGVLRIPTTIDAFTIDMVYDEAFANCSDLEKVILPAAVTSIGKKAFFACSRLAEITLPDHLTSVGEHAFDGTLLAPAPQASLVRIMKNVLVRADPSIHGEYAVPEQVSVIADDAFSGCTELTEVFIHDGVESIGKRAFTHCTSLKSIRLPKRIGQLGFGAFNGCNSLEALEVPEGVTVLNHFQNCSKLSRVSIPLTVETIEYNCFEGTALLDAFLENEEAMLVVDRWLIRYRATDCGNLDMGDGIVGIADQCPFTRFNGSNMPKLRNVHLSGGLKYIGANAFQKTALERVDLPAGLLYLGRACFRGTPLQSIDIPESVRIMEQWSLMDCESLEQIAFHGATEVVWPAITGRKDGRQITIVAKEGSSAHRYADIYGAKYNLKYKKPACSPFRRILDFSGI